MPLTRDDSNISQFSKGHAAMREVITDVKKGGWFEAAALAWMSFLKRNS